nr:hypothetical protein BaRGS_000989 [Batillaria attramentaria]
MTTPTEFKPGVADWSTVHCLTGALATPVKDPQKWSSFAWPQERLDQFHKDGFVSNVRVLSEDQCDSLLQDYRYFLGEEKHPGMDMMYEYHTNQSDDPNNVLMHALGQWRLTKLFHDLVFLPQVVVHIALEDQTEENGTIKYIPGSHNMCVRGQKMEGQFYPLVYDPAWSK